MTKIWKEVTPGRMALVEVPDNAPVRRGRCKHLGEDSGNKIVCPTCRGRVELKVYNCSVHSQCTLSNRSPGIACCDSQCQEYRPMRPPIKWQYGITTVHERLTTLFPGSQSQLARAGFDSPKVFIDGDHGHPKVRTAGRWILSLAELYLLDPKADRYAIFQDDFITYPNLKEYLDSCKMPDKGYWNLYSVPANEGLAPFNPTTNSRVTGWHLSNQRGKGAVALVFSNEGVIELLSSKHLWARAHGDKGHKSIDGGIIQSMLDKGWKEWVHYPSLTQHIGKESVSHNTWHSPSVSFLGDRYDAMQFLQTR